MRLGYYLGRMGFGILVVILVLGMLAASAWAQAPGAPGPSADLPTAGAPEPVGAGAAGVAVVILMIGLVAIIGAAGKAIDLRRRRETEAVHLEAQISDALLRDPTLYSLPITVTAHVPIWRGSPATIRVAGQVPTPEVRQAVLHIVDQQASRVRSDFRVFDRTEVVPSTGTRAA